MGGQQKKRSVAILIARRSDGAEVERHEMPLEDYYDGLHEIIDSATYRASRGIVVLEGTLLDRGGKLLQEFRNRYGAGGEYEGGRAVHADGTVDED
jgi:hypothetical protein